MKKFVILLVAVVVGYLLFTGNNKNEEKVLGKSGGVIDFNLNGVEHHFDKLSFNIISKHQNKYNIILLDSNKSDKKKAIMLYFDYVAIDNKVIANVDLAESSKEFRIILRAPELQYPIDASKTIGSLNFIVDKYDLNRVSGYFEGVLVDTENEFSVTEGTFEIPCKWR